MHRLQVSGLKVLSTVEFTRRNRFILASSLCFGLGNLLVPDFATHLVSVATVDVSTYPTDRPHPVPSSSRAL